MVALVLGPMRDGIDEDELSNAEGEAQDTKSPEGPRRQPPVPTAQHGHRVEPRTDPGCQATRVPGSPCSHRNGQHEQRSPGRPDPGRRLLRPDLPVGRGRPGRLACSGQAERQQREDRHSHVQCQGLDPAHSTLVLGVEHVSVLGIKADRKQPDAEHEQHASSDSDQDTARMASASPRAGHACRVTGVAACQSEDRSGFLPVRIVGRGSRYCQVT